MIIDTGTSSISKLDGTLNDATPRVDVAKEVVSPFMVDDTVEKEKLSLVVTTTESYSPLPTQVTTSAGNAPGKQVAYHVVANYVRNTWGKFWLIRSMFSSSTRLFSFQFSSMNKLDAMLENVWVKLYSVPVTAFSEDGLSAISTKLGMATILVIFALSMSENLLVYCQHLWKKKNDSESTKEVSQSNPFEVLNLVDNDVDLGTNGGISNSADKETINVSSSNTPIVEKIDKIERQIHKGKLRFVDDDGFLLVLMGIVDSDSEVEVVFDKGANLRLSTSGKDGSDKGEDDFEIVKVRDHVGFYVVSKDGTRTWYLDILPHGEKPIQGTQFVSIDQAYSFYVAYGKKAGFDVRRGGEYKAVGFGDVTTKYFHCTREGFLLNPKEKSSVKSLDVDISEHSEVSDGFERFRDPKKKQTRRKPMFRCGCLASLTIKRIGNVFEVTSMIEGHNHPLVAEKDMIFMKNSRNIGYTKQHFLYQVSNANFGPAIGDDDRLVGLSWADEEAIRNYATFGVSFDATFRSNKYQTVFVPFTGIIHHNRCVTFASGLLADETAGAYIWLLKQFKEAFGKDPKVVVTDQDPSMKIEIAKCFHDTSHRLCMWHIMMKLGTKAVKISSMGSKIMASGEDCLDGEGEVKVESMGGGVVLGVGQGEVKGGGVDFGVVNKLFLLPVPFYSNSLLASVASTFVLRSLFSSSRRGDGRDGMRHI
ncbi:FAR1 DNA binding domain, zinc finger, SWIM-type, MULE transposase domain containing protein [Tanacetum coccineum]